MKINLKKIGATVVGTLCSIAAFADGTAGNVAAPAQAALTDVANTAKDAVNTFGSALIPILGGIAGTMFLLFLGKKIYSLVKGWMGRS